jgi:N6-adenosine-specific RNA methylase IME4
MSAVIAIGPREPQRASEIRDTSKYRLMPDMTPAEFEVLKADIARRGVLVPLDVDETGEILDGHQRYRAWVELKKNEPPLIIVREGLSEQEKHAFVRKNNILRRHLTRDQIRSLIAEQLKETPDWADNRLAEELGVDGKTVGSVREDLEATSEFPKLDRLIGRDGKSRPRKQARERREPEIAALKGNPAPPTSANSKDRPQPKNRPLTYADRRLLELMGQQRLPFRGSELGNAPLPLDHRYPVILADPPWKFHLYGPDYDRSAERHYPVMETEEICALAVADIATPDAVLFMWTTAAHLPDALRVLEAWGFEYVTNVVWIKDSLGLGHWVRNQHELLIVARRGDMPSPAPADRPPSVIHAPRREHSRKPDEAYEVIERMYPGLPRIELFARRARPGWDAWGNEAPPTVAAA